MYNKIIKENRRIDGLGRVILNIDEIIELIKCNKPLINIVAEDSIDIQEYNNNVDITKILIHNNKKQNINEFDLTHTQEWFTPNKYKDINIDDFLNNKCTTDKQRSRVEYELSLYKELNLIPLLCHLIYLVDYFRDNNIIWGVGRGSSVSSYILFLIGIHKIDSLKFDISIHEFLKKYEYIE